MADVFISHARADRKRAEAIAEGLQAEGLSVTRAEAPARPAPLDLRPAVMESGRVLVCWSRAGARADELMIDAAQAFNQGKLTPVLLQADADPPYPFDLTPSLDLSGWRGRREDPAWQDLVRALRGAISSDASVRAAPPPPPAPPKPAVQTPNLFKPPPRPAEPEEAPRQLAEPEPEGANRIVVFALGALALIVLAMWGGPRLVALVNQTTAPPHSSLIPADDLLSSTSSDVPTATAEPDDAAPDLETPPPPLTVITPPPAPKSGQPISAPPPPTETKAAAPAQPTPAPKASVTPPPKAAAAAADPAATMKGLESCLAGLAKQCAAVDSAFAGGFTADGRLSAGERKLLSTSLFPDRSLVTEQNLSACRAATPAASARACAAIAPKPAAASPKPAPAAPKEEPKPTEKAEVPL